ncbi:MAG: hypothetical protein ACRCSV_02350 [Chlamydiales bacterium]
MFAQHHQQCNLAGLFVIGCSFCLYSTNINVTTNADSGAESLRAVIDQINSESDSSNAINMICLPKFYL